MLWEFFSIFKILVHYWYSLRWSFNRIFSFRGFTFLVASKKKLHCYTQFLQSRKENEQTLRSDIVIWSKKTKPSDQRNSSLDRDNKEGEDGKKQTRQVSRQELEGKTRLSWETRGRNFTLTGIIVSFCILIPSHERKRDDDEETQ